MSYLKVLNRYTGAVTATAVLVALGLAAALWWMSPSLSEEDVQRTIISTIQQEAPASFYVTGHLDVTASSHVRNTRTYLPGTLNLPGGTVEANVRVPGRVFYGFDVRALQPEHIRLGEGGVIEVTLPELQVYAVEPDLGQLEMQTSTGWARFYDRSGEQRVERAALSRIQPVLRQQGREHIQGATQPRVNTAEALEKLLTPVLQAAGHPAPTFRFQIDDRLVLQPEG